MDMQPAVVEHAFFHRAAGAGLAQQRADAGHQFLHAEGFGDVVVGAGIERGDLFGFAGAHGEHDHRHVGPLADLAQHFMPIAIGQADVQHHQFGALPGQQGQAFFAGAGLQHTIALRTQADVEETADLRLVVDDQHAGGGDGGEVSRHRGEVARRERATAA